MVRACVRMFIVFCAGNFQICAENFCNHRGGQNMSRRFVQLFCFTIYQKKIKLFPLVCFLIFLFLFRRLIPSTVTNLPNFRLKKQSKTNEDLIVVSVFSFKTLIDIKTIGTNSPINLRIIVMICSIPSRFSFRLIYRFSYIGLIYTHILFYSKCACFI